MAVSMNTTIARVHELNNKMIGLQLSGAKLLAVVMSAICVVFSMVIVVTRQHPGDKLMLGAALVGGLLIAILIEGFNLGILHIIRVQSDNVKGVEEEYRAVARQENRQLTYQEEEALLARVKPMKRIRAILVPFSLVGIALSGAAGWMFWEMLLEALDPTVKTSLSIAFALVISLTFLIGEVFRGQIDNAIHESITSASMREAAIENERSNRVLEMKRAAYNKMFNDPRLKEALEQNILVEISQQHGITLVINDPCEQQPHVEQVEEIEDEQEYIEGPYVDVHHRLEQGKQHNTTENYTLPEKQPSYIFHESGLETTEEAPNEQEEEELTFIDSPSVAPSTIEQKAIQPSKDAFSQENKDAFKQSVLANQKQSIRSLATAFCISTGTASKWKAKVLNNEPL